MSSYLRGRLEWCRVRVLREFLRAHASKANFWLFKYVTEIRLCIKFGGIALCNTFAVETIAAAADTVAIGIVLLLVDSPRVAVVIFTLCNAFASMSFRDVATANRQLRRHSKGDAQLMMAQRPSQKESYVVDRTRRPSAPLPPSTSTRSNSYVLHGKVHYVGEASPKQGESDVIVTHNRHKTTNQSPSSSSRRWSPSTETCRQIMQRQSTFTQLTNETIQFQKLVADLEDILNHASVGESPEAAWRARILIRSAQETDKDLWKKLYDYERTLLVEQKNCKSSTYAKENLRQTTNDATSIRNAQSACMKLHRDFKRIHKSLVMALSLYETKQNAEVSRLGAVGWSNPQGNDEDEIIGKEPPSEDFFDRALRQAELEKMNQSMHQVNDIYQDLAALVDVQQADIDRLEENIAEAKEHVNSAGFWFGACNPTYSFLQADEEAEPIHSKSRDDVPADNGPLCGAIDVALPDTGITSKDLWSFPFQSMDISCGGTTPEPSHTVAISAGDAAVEVECVDEDLADKGVERVSSLLSSSSASPKSIFDPTVLQCNEPPYEMLKRNVVDIQQDIAYFGNEVISQGRRMECGAASS